MLHCFIMASIMLNTIFPSLLDFKLSLCNRALRDHFEIRSDKSDTTQVVASCQSSGNCPFRIWCHFNPRLEQAIVTRLISDHNCLGAASVHASEANHLSWLEIAVSKQKKDIVGVHFC